MNLNNHTMVWMFVSPQSSFVDILIPKDDSRRWGFGRWWSHKGGALVSGISAL